MPKLSAVLPVGRAGARRSFWRPGGPFWAERTTALGSILKGEYTGGGDPVAAAREFSEEIGLVPTPRIDSAAKQSGGKVVTVFGVQVI